MPCFYTGSEVGDIRLNNEEQRRALSEVTEMLCEICKELEEADLLDHLPEKTLDWWKKHKKIDKKRKAEEVDYAKKAVLAQKQEIQRKEKELKDLISKLKKKK